MIHENNKRFLDTIKEIAPLLEEIVFVGGITTYMYLPTAASDVRVTMDVDAIIDADVKKYQQAESQLRKLGFQPVPDVRCRYKKGDLIIDLMPIDARILGFTNKWYGEGIKNAETKKIGDRTFRILQLKYFFATKIEAFLHRGNGDFYGSKDMDDIITVLAGRPGVIGEFEEIGGDVGKYLRERFSEFLESTDFLQAIDGNLPRSPTISAAQIITDLKLWSTES